MQRAFDDRSCPVLCPEPEEQEVYALEGAVGLLQCPVFTYGSGLLVTWTKQGVVSALIFFFFLLFGCGLRKNVRFQGDCSIICLIMYVSGVNACICLF